MKKVKTKENVTTYARPSTNAIQVNHYGEGEHELTVYPSVEGWYELRPVDYDGIMNTEFIQKKDVK
ncbi:hypothetical protein [Niallia sp. NCCP-28]|uniref:hypothetical protein n=1 Tax=Niallia sp. NCCP-28 TaxID=2934712 RepID=UPI00207E050C|nr:hypothetical protein [Niallia sp. NCCP-28]GKU83790.1 hypothetical protein NCCP28_31860 [Niallia sp. NCCP-28]